MNESIYHFMKIFQNSFLKECQVWKTLKLEDRLLELKEIEFEYRWKDDIVQVAKPKWMHLAPDCNRWQRLGEVYARSEPSFRY